MYNKVMTVVTACTAVALFAAALCTPKPEPVEPISNAIAETLAVTRVRLAQADSVKAALLLHARQSDSALAAVKTANAAEKARLSDQVRFWRDSATVRDSAGRPYVLVDSAEAALDSLRNRLNATEAQALTMQAQRDSIVTVDSLARLELEKRYQAIAADDSTRIAKERQRAAYEASWKAKAASALRGLPWLGVGILLGAVAR